MDTKTLLKIEIFLRLGFFDNTYDKKERDFAKKLTKTTKQDLHTVYNESTDFLMLPKVIKALEEPLGDSIIIPTYKLFKEVSTQNKVALSGEGADELLGGYSHHWLFYVLKKLQKFKLLDLPVEKFVPESFLSALLPYPGQFEKGRLLKILNQLRSKGLKRYLEMTHLFNSEEIENLFPGLLKESGFSKKHSPETSTLKDILNFEIQNWLPNYNLLRIDKLSMAHSLEVRVPYLNMDFAEVCLHLPEQAMISLFQRKKILRRFAYKESFLDFKTAYRKKHPFTLKEHKTWTKQYRTFIKDHLDGSFIKTWAVSAKTLNKLLDKDFQYLVTQKQITSLLHLSVWTKSFFK